MLKAKPAKKESISFWIGKINNLIRVERLLVRGVFNLVREISISADCDGKDLDGLQFDIRPSQ